MDVDEPIGPNVDCEVCFPLFSIKLINATKNFGNLQQDIYHDKSIVINYGKSEPDISLDNGIVNYLQSHQDQLIHFVDPDDVDPNLFVDLGVDLPIKGNQQLSGDLLDFIQSHYKLWVSLNTPPQRMLQCTSCCTSSGPFYSCFECFDQNLFCSSCICKQHQYAHFHRIWCYDTNKGHYSPTMLSQLGHITHISHDDGSTCKNPGQLTKLNIYHINGFHTINTPLCNCIQYGHLSKKLTTQRLMANRLFPQTWLDPSSAYTFDLLSISNMLNLKSFINIKQLCDTIIAITPESLQAKNISKEASGRMRNKFGTVLRLFRLMNSMQRVGAKNYEDFLNIGVAGNCPVCILPGVNVPADWQSREYLYV
jgi:hypothetical protein